MVSSRRTHRLKKARQSRRKSHRRPSRKVQRGGEVQRICPASITKLFTTPGIGRGRFQVIDKSDDTFLGQIKNPPFDLLTLVDAMRSSKPITLVKRVKEPFEVVWAAGTAAAARVYEEEGLPFKDPRHAEPWPIEPETTEEEDRLKAIALFENAPPRAPTPEERAAAAAAKRAHEEAEIRHERVKERALRAAHNAQHAAERSGQLVESTIIINDNTIKNYCFDF